jgi:hypothetical protein
MAIKILNVGAARGILSVSFNKGVRGDAGKLIIKKLGSASASFSDVAPTDLGGFNIGGNWKLVSTMTGDEPGGQVTTLEYIDGSYILDTKNIVLFKRNINGTDAEYDVTKTVKIPVVTFSFSNGSGSFTIEMQDRNITVKRKKSNAISQGILGEEEWSSNPCEPSTVTYDCSDALKLIGVTEDIGAGKRCSYEGSYRNVLGNIAAKLGKLWYWDNTAPKLWDSSNIAQLPSLDDGCQIYSKMTGETLEGSTSLASWTYQRLVVPTRSAKQTVEVYEYPTTAPVLHPNYPSDMDYAYDTIGPLREYHAYIAANGFDYSLLAKQGSFITDDFTMIFATLVFQLSIDFLNTFGIPYNYGGSSPLIGDGLREVVYAKMGVREDYTFDSTSGLVRIVGGWSRKYYEDEKTSELFYPAPKINSHTFTGSSINYKVADVNVEPSPERRGLNKLADTYEDQNRIIRTGIWRGVSIDKKESAPGTGTDSEAWGKSIANCMGGVNGDILRYILDGALNFKNGTGYFKSLLDNGYQIWYIVPPNYPIGSFSSEAINNNDLTQTADYVDPNELPPVITEKQQESEDEAKRYDDPCEDLIQKATTDAETTDDVIIIGNKDKKSGLTDPTGTSYTFRCLDGEVTFVTPSLNNFQWKVKTTYQFSIVAEGTADVSNVWKKSGSINASADVLNHSIAITELPSPEQMSEEVSVPEASQSVGPVPVAEYVINGFYLPTNHPTLESLSATLDPQEGLIVSYRYRGLRPQPLPSTLTISPNAYQVNVNVS